MVRRAPKARTEAEIEARKDLLQSLNEGLASQVDSLLKSDGWMHFLNFSSKFHKYSINNTLLILMQCPEATYVAGASAWSNMHRHINKGEKALKIYGFSVKKVTEEGKEGAEDKERVFVTHPICNVFDISQTGPLEGWVEPVSPVKKLEGYRDGGLYASCEAVLKSLGWETVRESIAGSANGYTTSDGSKRVIVDSDLAPAMAAKTALHELAHVVLDHVSDMEEYRQHRGSYELEAESVAYVVSGALGFDTSEYSVGYVASWAKEGAAELAKASAERVLKTSQTILENLELHGTLLV